MELTEKTKLIDVLKHFPESKKVFKKYKLECFKCRGIGHETLQKCCMQYGLDTDKFIQEIKQICPSSLPQQSSN